jgi:hypothetical protein
MPQNETYNAILVVNSNFILVVASFLPRNYYPRSDITMPSSKGYSHIKYYRESEGQHTHNHCVPKGERNMMVLVNICYEEHAL